MVIRYRAALEEQDEKQKKLLMPFGRLATELPESLLHRLTYRTRTCSVDSPKLSTITRHLTARRRSRARQKHQHRNLRLAESSEQQREIHIVSSID
ncbi:hypothetical protein Q1695_010134 [Nippostrongylus brasiliensis]|nr:hypothetical protein Q1695_010134 [Nippostrongylus brasiliensis]